MISKVIFGQNLSASDPLGFKQVAEDLRDVMHVMYETSEFTAAVKNLGFDPADMAVEHVEYEVESHKCSEGHIHRDIQICEIFNACADVTSKPTLSLEAAASMMANAIKEDVPEEVKSLHFAQTAGAVFPYETKTAKGFGRIVNVSQIFHTQESLDNEKIKNHLAQPQNFQNSYLN